MFPRFSRRTASFWQCMQEISKVWAHRHSAEAFSRVLFTWATGMTDLPDDCRPTVTEPPDARLTTITGSVTPTPLSWKSRTSATTRVWTICLPPGNVVQVNDLLNGKRRHFQERNVSAYLNGARLARSAAGI